MKALYIAEKPSVAQEFAKALHENMQRHEGYLECGNAVVTWCVGHLVTMSYPEVYDASLKRWSFQTLPFLPKEYKYEVIPSAAKQFNIVKGLLNREDVGCIYICTDSGREGEYIYRLVDQMAGVPASKERKRVWIDSQTEEEILRGIKEAKPMKEYDNLSNAAYLRAKEDYLMGINFSRALTLKYGYSVKNYLKREKSQAISVGRVMTCVLGMVVRREREIREFVKTPFYRVIGKMNTGQTEFEAEWRAVEGTVFAGTPALYKENGFKEKNTALEMIRGITGSAQTADDTKCENIKAVVEKVEKKKETKQPSMLYNLTELQNDCSRFFKISPEETLKVVQELYEQKLVTYPRTDARVLSTAISKEIYKNINGLKNFAPTKEIAEKAIEFGTYKTIAKTKYVNDKQITDHYAIIPTGQGFFNLNRLSQLHGRVYDVIARRFLAIFYPPAIYQKISLEAVVPYKQGSNPPEHFFAGFKIMVQEGYLSVTGNTSSKDKFENADSNMMEMMGKLRKGSSLSLMELTVKEGETTPPKRYNSGSLMLAMENAGQLIEDEELRAQIKGSGIGTSATRASILDKLVKIDYLSLNKKTQIITPSLQGEMIYDVVNLSIRSLLNPELTASWEKGLTLVAEGKVTNGEYMEKLEDFVGRLTSAVSTLNNQSSLYRYFDAAAKNYKI